MADRPPGSVGSQRAVAKIDLAALSHNVGEIRRLVGSDVRLCAVVKTDAYGHGAVPISRHLVRCGVDSLAVASVEEATELREAGISGKILVFGAASAAEAAEAVRLGITPTISSLENARELVGALDGAEPLEVHLKLDTGMRRMGIGADEVDSLAAILKDGPLKLEGIFSHLAHADSPGHESITEQRRELENAVTRLHAAGIDVRIRHLSGSAGILADRATHLDMVRPGIALYGGLPHPTFNADVSFKPVMEVTTRVAQLRSVQAGDGIGYGHTWRAPRDSRVAVLPIGYGQGYLRALSNRGYTLIKGRLAPVVGTVSMDHMMIDVTSAGAVRTGDEVVLWGGPQESAPDVMVLAERAETIGYELLTRVGGAIPRTYVEPFG